MVAVFFSQLDDGKPSSLIYTPPVSPSDETTGLLATPDSEYPMSFNYDFQPYEIDNGQPPADSPWNDPSLSPWVDLAKPSPPPPPPPNED